MCCSYEKKLWCVRRISLLCVKITQTNNAVADNQDMKKEINYLKGDATTPEGAGNKIIAHICNDMGGWGKGFVTAVSRRWKQPEKQYREWFRKGEGFRLGAVQLVQVEADVWIANIIGQHKIYKDEAGEAPVRYEAIREGLDKVGVLAQEMNAVVHMPRIGCGLAGGKWELIEPLIREGIADRGVPVTVYDY